MRLTIGFALGMIVSAAPAVAAAPEVQAAITEYCEPLVNGSTAEQVGEIARADGFKWQTVSGQRVLIKDQLLLSISQSPRVCFLQALRPTSFQEGSDLVDAWAAGQQGARRLAATAGPDGSPVRGWAVPARKITLMAVQQRSASGDGVVAFILSPLQPQPPVAR